MIKNVNIKLLTSALSDIEALENEIDLLLCEGKTVADLRDIFDSFSTEQKNLFDINYGCLVATIKYRNEKSYRLYNRFSIWDEQGLIADSITKKDIEKAIKKNNGRGLQ